MHNSHRQICLSYKEMLWFYCHIIASVFLRAILTLCGNKMTINDQRLILFMMLMIQSVCGCFSTCQIWLEGMGCACQRWHAIWCNVSHCLHLKNPRVSLELCEHDRYLKRSYIYTTLERFFFLWIVLDSNHIACKKDE